MNLISYASNFRSGSLRPNDSLWYVTLRCCAGARRVSMDNAVRTVLTRDLQYHVCIDRIALNLHRLQ